MTSLGIIDVPAATAGAASGLVNTAHQLGMATGLALLLALSARAGADNCDSGSLMEVDDSR